MLMDLSGLFDETASPVLTVEEAARAMRIGRSLAYQFAREYLASGGLTGMPAIRIGSCLRVPRWALLELLCTGRVVRLCDAVVPTGGTPTGEVTGAD